MCKNSQNRSIPSKFIGRNRLPPLFLASWSRHVPTLRRRNPANNCRDVTVTSVTARRNKTPGIMGVITDMPWHVPALRWSSTRHASLRDLGRAHCFAQRGVITQAVALFFFSDFFLKKSGLFFNLKKKKKNDTQM